MQKFQTGHRGGSYEMAGKYRRARGQSSSPSNSSEFRNLLTQDSSEDELPSLSKHLI